MPRKEIKVLGSEIRVNDLLHHRKGVLKVVDVIPKRTRVVVVLRSTDGSPIIVQDSKHERVTFRTYSDDLPMDAEYNVDRYAEEDYDYSPPLP
ncbi:MAG TPA: hypothetical protein VM715_12620 [Candidatus Acidoferrum sp.]|nr:hypothetical protein [Candidatus Acidoferrum sp.]